MGTGDCTDLLVEAFKEAGARPCIKADDGAYLWGEPVKSYKEAKPGDVVQFEKVVFKGTRRGVDENGNPSLSYHKDAFPHHSAVVLSVSVKGKTLTLLHQNVADEEGKLDRTVREQTPEDDNGAAEGRVADHLPAEATESGPGPLGPRSMRVALDFGDGFGWLGSRPRSAAEAPGPRRRPRPGASAADSGLDPSRPT